MKSKFESHGAWIKHMFEQVSFVEGQENKDLQREHVTLDELVNYLTTNFDLSDHLRGGLRLTAEKTRERVKDYLMMVVVQGQEASKQEIHAKHLKRAFLEKLEIKISMQHYLQIGLNTCVDIENIKLGKF